jgi:hypothetical protein
VPRREQDGQGSPRTELPFNGIQTRWRKCTTERNEFPPSLMSGAEPRGNSDPRGSGLGAGRCFSMAGFAACGR